MTCSPKSVTKGARLLRKLELNDSPKLAGGVGVDADRLGIGAIVDVFGCTVVVKDRTKIVER